MDEEILVGSKRKLMNLVELGTTGAKAQGFSLLSRTANHKISLEDERKGGKEKTDVEETLH